MSVEAYHIDKVYKLREAYRLPVACYLGSEEFWRSVKRFNVDGNLRIAPPDDEGRQVVTITDEGIALIDGGKRLF